MTKDLLFSVTEKDCTFTYTKGSGSGGQKRNKTLNAVYCKHNDSGAVGYSEDTRSQRENKIIAFKRMSQTEKFQTWHKLEIARETGLLARIEDEVDRSMKQVKVEVKEDGRWVDEKSGI